MAASLALMLASWPSLACFSANFSRSDSTREVDAAETEDPGSDEPATEEPAADRVSAADLTDSADKPPVRVTPELAGSWRWIGAKTLLFEAKPRLPMATEVTIEVPKGTKSAIGGTLAEAYKYSFRTPPPRLRPCRRPRPRPQAPSRGNRGGSDPRLA